MELDKDVTVDPKQIERVMLVKKGAKIGARIATMPSSDAEDLRAPEDELIVHMKDGSATAIRGEQEAKRAWDALDRGPGRAAPKFWDEHQRPTELALVIATHADGHIF
jgi:hypothetical protein